MFRQKSFNFIISFIFIFNFSFISLAQNQRFTYEYIFKPDTLQHDKKIKELMNLDVSRDGSYFYSAALIARDSLFNAEVEKGKMGGSISIDMRKVKQAKVQWRIAKSYSDMQTEYQGMLNAVNLAVKETEPVTWKILPDIKTIEGFKVQKAVTVYKGRKWTVWFTEEIQIHDGPYRFSELPGLVLHAEDDQQLHVFTFVGSRKLTENQLLKDRNVKRVYVTAQKYNRLWNEYIKDPAKNIKIIHSSAENDDTIIFDSNTGKPLSKETLIRSKEKGMEKYLKEYNVCIECELHRIDRK